MTDLGRIDILRMEALRAAVSARDWPPRPGREHVDGVLHDAGAYLAEWLDAKPARVSRDPIAIKVSDQGTNPPNWAPISRRHPRMEVINDGQNILYPPRTATDAKGFTVEGGVAFTTDDDAAQQFTTRTDNPDGSTQLSAKAPGTVQVTWTAGTDSLADTLNITTGDAVSFSDIEPVITDQ